MNRERVLITAALPYANGVLHFGHLAGAFLPADCYARFQRLIGNQVLFISGSDEYGVAIALSAELEGTSPKRHADTYHSINHELLKKFQISMDYFSRTTNPHHAPLVDAFFQDLLGNGFIEEQESEQLYSEQDGRFLADRYVIGTCPRCKHLAARGDECSKCGASYEASDLIEPRSKLTGAPLVRRLTLHWILRFDRFKESLEKFISVKNWKPNVVNFSRQYVEDLLPRSITRDLEWGVPVPLAKAEGKVFYVWFDAPIGYISATQDWATQQGAPSAWEEYWLNPETRYVQFLGKDNIPFHAVFFPAMIMGQNRPYKLVDDLVANEFYNLEGKKFSKSDGWMIDLDRFFQKFTVDQIRYTIAANAPETADSEFTWKEFQQRCNADLVGKLGNFVHRTLTFITDRLGGKLPDFPEITKVEPVLIQLRELMGQLKEHYSQYRLRKATSLIMEMAQVANGYFDQQAPWKAIKTGQHAQAEHTLAVCWVAAKYLALASSPIIPGAAQTMWELLGEEGVLESQSWDQILHAPFHMGILPKPFPIFKKIEDDMIKEEITLLHATQKTPETPVAATNPTCKPEISYDVFDAIDLRVGTIKQAKKVEKSKKLLELRVDLGWEERTIVSGISMRYTPEELIGRQVIVVANLKPTKLMGIESQGMLLAGHLDTMLELASIPSSLPPGSPVT